MPIARESLLAHLQGEERFLGGHLLDLAERALAQERPLATPFLDPAEMAVVTGVLSGIPELRWQVDGGIPQAERARLVLYPEYLLEELLPPTVRVVCVEADSVELSHRDVLGSALGLGLERNRLGDVVLNGNKAYIMATPEAAETLLAGLTRVGRLDVRTHEVDPEQVDVGARRSKEIRTTVASLRLDAVAAAGYGSSRTRIAREVKAGRIKVNWTVVQDPAHLLREGDVLSLRGRGRVEVASVGSNTRKGRTSLLLRRVY